MQLIINFLGSSG